MSLQATASGRLIAGAVVPAWFAPAALILPIGSAVALPGHPGGLGLALVGTGLCCA